MIELVTDRTQQDVNQHTEKGVYTHVDLNRVGTAINVIASLFTQYGYPVSVDAATNRTSAFVPQVSNMEQYLSWINAVRVARFIKPSTPQTPQTMANLTYQTANNIEQILLDVYTQLNGAIAEMRPLGTFYLGE